MIFFKSNRERERESEQVGERVRWREGEREKEREGENLEQTPCSAQSLTQGLIPGPWDPDLSQNKESDA